MNIFPPLIIAIVIVIMTLTSASFSDARALEMQPSIRITLPQFSGCKAIETGFLGGLFGGNKCHSGHIQIDEAITAIAEHAFKDGSLTQVDFFGDMLKSIGRGAFFGNKLTDVDIPDTVTTIGQESFSKNQLMKVKLSNSVKTIEPYAFSNNKIKVLEIPDSVVGIKKGAFYHNDLIDVVIPDTVKTLESQAFMENKIKSLTLSKKLTSLRDSVFAKNELKFVLIPDKVTDIEAHAFLNNKLTSIKFSKSVKYVGSKAFAGNPLKSACYEGDKAPKIESDVGFDIKMLKKCELDTPKPSNISPNTPNNTPKCSNIANTFKDLLRDENNFDSIKPILENINNQIDCMDSNGHRLLFQAAYDGKIDIVNTLLRNGADPNAINGEGFDSEKVSGQTALMAACIQDEVLENQEDIVMSLLRYNADKTIKDTENNSACYHAKHNPNNAHLLQRILNCFDDNSEL